MENKKLIHFYNKVYRKGGKQHFSKSDEHREAIKELNWKGKSVLDIGCGEGSFAYMVSKRVGIKGSVTGLDYSKKAIEKAKKSYRRKNLTFIHGDINKIKIEKYDVIVSLGTIEHMDEPLKILAIFKKHLKRNGKILITSPNWTNPRGYMLIILKILFDAPITLADLHYFTPNDFFTFAKKLDMELSWRTIDYSWAHGKVLINDFKKRLPNVLRDMSLKIKQEKIDELISWLKCNVLSFDNKLKHSGATGIYLLH